MIHEKIKYNVLRSQFLVSFIINMFYERSSQKNTPQPYMLTRNCIKPSIDWLFRVYYKYLIATIGILLKTIDIIHLPLSIVFYDLQIK